MRTRVDLREFVLNVYFHETTKHNYNIVGIRAEGPLRGVQGGGRPPCQLLVLYVCYDSFKRFACKTSINSPRVASERLSIAIFSYVRGGSSL